MHGALTTGPDGDITILARRGVLLASGGFGRNAELVHHYAPQYDNAVFVCGDGNVGDGLAMARKLGADMRDMIYIEGTYGKHPVDTLNHHSCLAVYKGAIAVNEYGKRWTSPFPPQTAGRRGHGPALSPRSFRSSTSRFLIQVTTVCASWISAVAWKGADHQGGHAAGSGPAN